VIQAVNPTAGPLVGGQVLTISGQNLSRSDIVNVTVAGVPVLSILSQNVTQVIVVTGPRPAAALGSVNITTTRGESRFADSYTYLARASLETHSCGLMFVLI
jgi:hypothetical protein